MSTVLKHSAAAVRIVSYISHYMTNSHLFLKARLYARSRAQAYATSSAVRKGNNLRTSNLFPVTTDRPGNLVVDLIQDLYLKELESYKAPSAVRHPIFAQFPVRVLNTLAVK